MSSERVFVSRGEGDELQLSLNGATMSISELRVRPMSNWKTPHQLLAKGGASIALTDAQLMQVVGEYLRYRINESCSHSQKQVGYEFTCTVKRGD
jgi:hypothetical protein